MNPEYLHFTLNHWVEYIQKQHWRTMDMNLQRISQVWCNLGSPLNAFTIVVGGTNGKGSSISMLESVIRENELSCGVYTSPHLVHFNERIRVNGIEATDQEICQAFCRIEQCRQGITLTYFEYATVCALLIFSQRKVQVCILEVGMGGRLDAVNMVDSDIVLITSIGIDHQQWLGTDREQIAREKAGLLRKNGIAVCSDPDTPAAIYQTADELGTRLISLNRDFRVELHCSRPGAALIAWKSDHRLIPEPWRELDQIRPPFAGEHQIVNLSGVIAVLAVISEQLGLDPCALPSGLGKSRISGRCQVISTQPTVVIDVAHNADSAGELAKFLQSMSCQGRTIAVLGVLADKDLNQIIPKISDLVDHWVVASLHEDRGQTSKELAEKLSQFSDPATHIRCDNPVEAYKQALKLADSSDRVVIFGSFHTVGDIIGHIEQHDTVS